MEFTPRLALLALLLLVLPAAVTVLFLARNAHPAVESGAQPGGVIEGRLEPLGASGGASVGGVELVVQGDGTDGSRREVARGTTDTDGTFAIRVPPLDGHYTVFVKEGAWQLSAVPTTLLGDTPAARAPIVVPVRAAARLELTFVRRSGTPVRGGRWSVVGEGRRSWFSASGAHVESGGEFDGPTLVVDGLPPMRARVLVRLDGGDRSELVVDLAVGPNRHTVEL